MHVSYSHLFIICCLLNKFLFILGKLAKSEDYYVDQIRSVLSTCEPEVDAEKSRKKNG